MLIDVGCESSTPLTANWTVPLLAGALRIIGWRGGWKCQGGERWFFSHDVLHGEQFLRLLTTNITRNSRTK